MRTKLGNFIKRSKLLFIFALLAVAVFQLFVPVQSVAGIGNTTPSEPEYGYIEPKVVTVSSTGITSTSAVLTGDLTSLGSASLLRVKKVDVYFKYGKTWNSTIYPSWAGGITTPKQEMYETGQFSANLSDLEPGTTYYFRAVGYGDGTFLGNCLTFETPPAK